MRCHGDYDYRLYPGIHIFPLGHLSDHENQKYDPITIFSELRVYQLFGISYSCITLIVWMSRITNLDVLYIWCCFKTIVWWDLWLTGGCRQPESQGGELSSRWRESGYRGVERPQSSKKSQKANGPIHPLALPTGTVATVPARAGRACIPATGQGREEHQAMHGESPYCR